MKVEVRGAAAKIDAIFRFDKDVWAGIQKGVKAAGESVAADARNRIPATALYSRNSPGWGNWIASRDGRNLGFDQQKIRAGIKPRFQSKMKNGVRVVKARADMTTPAGAIYSLAGSKNRSGKHFSDEVNTQHGSSVWPRSLTPAYYAKGPQAAKDIAKVIEDAVSNVNQA